MTTLFDLTGKKAVVVGGAGGIGQTIAEGLAEAGAQVMISSRKEDSLKRAQTGIRENCGANILYHVADASVETDVEVLLQAAVTQMGTVDIALIAGVLSNFDDSISILEIPYLFRSEEEFETIIYGDIGQEIADHVRESSGIRILNWWQRGPRLITSSKPINSVDDMKGLKIRIPEINAMEQVFSAWGAAATTMSWSEVYSSLQQGVIEAQENPIPFFYSGSIYEVNKYIANTNHKYEYVTMAMSDAVYSSLTPEQQEIIMQAAQDATDYENSETVKVTEANLQDMVDNYGVTVTDPDTTGFIEIADQVAPEYAESIGQLDLYNKIIEALGR